MSSSGNLDRYKPLSPLASGGMATVMLAHDALLDRRVALKRLNAAAADARGRTRLRREALIGASVSHPNLVSIYDIVELEDGDEVIVMEYVPGRTLRDLLAGGKRLPASAAIRILEGVSGGLDAIHRRGIVHRDVKPANILLGTDGTVKLADLGIASVPDRTRITTAGTVLGTFSYMAPEQLEGARATPALDIYALAAVTFEMLSGRKARSAANPVALAHAMSTQPPPDLRDAWPQAPPAAAEVLMQAMSRDTRARPGSAGELAEMLRAALAPPASQPRAQPVRVAGESTRGRGLGRDRAVGAAGALGAGALASRRSSQPAQRSRGAARSSHPAARTGLATRTAVRRISGDRAGRPTETMRAGASPAVRRDDGARRYRRIKPGVLIALLLGAVALAVVLTAPQSHPSSSRTARTGSSARSAARARTHTARSGVSAAGGGKSASGAAARTAPAGSAATAPAGSSGAAPPVSTPAAASPASRSATPPAPATGAAAAAASGPVSAVESFYELAAAHRYAEAWALADPMFRAQLGGYRSFEAGQAGDRSITFTAANVVNQAASVATVAIRTISVRYDGTRHCSGTVELRVSSAGGGWLLHRINIGCA